MTLLAFTNGSSDEVVVPKELFQEARQRYTAPDHHVHDLVPPEVHDCLKTCFEQLPDDLRHVHEDSVWETYTELLAKFRAVSVTSNNIGELVQSATNAPLVGEDPDERMELVPGQAVGFGPVPAGTRQEVQEAIVEFDDGELIEEDENQYAFEANFSDAE